MIDQLQDFFDYLKYQKRYSPHTLLSYENDLDGFFQYQNTMYQNSSYKDTQSMIVRSWVVHLSKEGFEPRSINRKISALNSCFKFFVKRGDLLTNPMKHINLLKVAKRLPSFFTENDMDSAKILINPNLSEFETLRNKLIINILYQTGCRKAELIFLKTYDVSYSRFEITFMGKGKKERNVPISPELVNDIKTYEEIRKDLIKEIATVPDNLFLSSKGKEMQPKAIYNIVKDQLHLLSTSDKKSPHVLRHTFATHMLNNGADINAIKELLGHASLAATQVYTHNSIARLKEVYEKAHPSANKVE